MTDIRDAGPRLRQMNDVLEENERLRGQLAWTERERDSLRRSIKNLAAYVAELNAEIESLRASARPQPHAKSDEKRGDSHTAGGTNSPRNGALSGCETVPDTDSRVWETPCTPQSHATPTQGSGYGEGSVPCSRTENEPVAWAVIDGDWFHDVRLSEWTAQNYADHMNKASGSAWKYRAVPLYRQPQPAITPAEMDAVSVAVQCVEAARAQKHPEQEESRYMLYKAGNALLGLLERMK